MDDVNSFCSTTKEIQKICKKIFNKGAIEQEIKEENNKWAEEMVPYRREKDTSTPIVSHIKSLMRITNPEGLELLESLQTTLTSLSMNDAYKLIYEDDQDAEETYFTNDDLNVPLAFKRSIEVVMLSKLDLHFIFKKNINASNGKYVSVGDVLEAFFENNREIYKQAQKSTGKENPDLGNQIYFEGLK